MRFLKIYFILLFAFCVTIVGAQTPSKMIEFSANTVKYRQDKGAQMLIGNVVFKHENTIITCDSAYKFNNNTLEAYNHIVIRKGDSLTITGDNLKYDGNTKMALLEGNVLCVEKDMTLTTPALSFDVKNSIASYFAGGTINNKENTLTSRSGYYYSASKTLAFKHNVKLTNPKYKVEGDTLLYNTLSKTVFFVGPTKMLSEKNKIYCEYGWYNTQTEKSHLNTNAAIYYDKTELHADSIYYDRKVGYGRAYSCVQIRDTAHKTELLGDLAEHFEGKGISIVTKNAVLIKVMDKDSILLSADTLFSQQFERTKKTKDSLAPKNKQVIKDSLAVDSLTKDSIIVKAYKHVKLFKKDLRGIADSLTFKSADSTLTLYNNPILWSDSAQLNAREIKVHMTSNAIKGFELKGNAFIITQEDSVKFNQIKGKEIIGTFYKDTIDRIQVTGNAQVAYFIKNESKQLTAYSKTNCAYLTVYFKKGEMDRITFISKPTSALIPVKEVNPEKEKFKGFSWNPGKKPKSKTELLKY